MKEHRELPLEPTYNQPPYPTQPQNPQKPSFPLISPYYHSKSKLLTAIFSNFEHFLITNSSKCIARMKEHRELPLETNLQPTSILLHNLKILKILKNHHFPLISPYYHSKSKFLTAVFSNFEHFLVTNSSKYIARMKEHRELPLEPTYNRPSYPYTTSKYLKIPQNPQIISIL